MAIKFGPQLCGDLEAGARREWLVADGLGGYAMGTVPGLRTRRYHGLLVPATAPPGGRRLALASLDPTLVIGDRRVHLAVHEWASGAIDPGGFVHLESFALEDGLPVWTWRLEDVRLQRRLAMLHGRSGVGIVHRLLSGSRAIRLRLDALCTWRDIHGERFAAGAPTVERGEDGFTFERAFRVSGPGFEPAGEWYQGVHYRVEAERGLDDREDLWHAGAFTVQLEPGEEVGVLAWYGDLHDVPPPAAEIVVRARARARSITGSARPQSPAESTLVTAADQFIVAGPTVVAGYPWFGDWSRDTLTSYEGLFLETGRAEEGRRLLLRLAGTLSDGMLANTADAGGTEYNTADASLWLLHAVGRHVARTGDADLAAAVLPALGEIIDRHLAGTRYGIGVDPSDGLLRQGAEGLALTWMDARVAGHPVTARAGKAVEVNALWVSGLAEVATRQELVGTDATRSRQLERRARSAFPGRFLRDGHCLDVVDPDDGRLRPNCLLAVSLPHAPLADREVVEAGARSLLTSLGLRSLAPSDPNYIGRHRGGPAARDSAYHQGTVWPWLIGPFVEAAIKTGVDPAGVLDGLDAHLGEWGLGSVSETADGEPPHAATGCPMQAWSVAELLRAHRLVAASTR